jgi:hypothetical protein
MILGSQTASKVFTVICDVELGKPHLLSGYRGRDLIRGNDGIGGRRIGKKRMTSCNGVHYAFLTGLYISLLHGFFLTVSWKILPLLPSNTSSTKSILRCKNQVMHPCNEAYTFIVGIFPESELF